MATRVVEWDDFTGGFYVGPSATKQPRNTFQGSNVCVAMDDATLIPMYETYDRNLTGTDVTSGIITNAGWEGVGPPAALNGMVFFTAKTSSAAYLYAVASNGAVTRHTLTLGGSVANFRNVRPTVTSAASGTSDVFVYIGGDYRRIIRLRITSTGTLSATLNITMDGMTAVGDNQVYGTAAWGARLMAWSASGALYFSNAADFGVFGATNYIIIGYNEDAITTVVARNYDLIVGKPSGWYVVTGVLNYSAAVRQINNGIGILGPDPVAEWNNQVVFGTNTGTYGFPVNLYTVNGARVQPMMFQRFAGNLQSVNMAKGPLGVLQVCYTLDDDTDVSGMIFLLNQQNRWCRGTIITHTGAVPGDTVSYYPAWVSQSRTDYWSLPTCEIMEYNSTQKKVALHAQEIATFEPGTDDNYNPAVGTVLLPDYMSQVPITITDVYVEVELVQLLNSLKYNQPAVITCQINMKYPPADLAFSVGNVSSTLVNVGNTYSGDSIPGTGTRFMGRVFRFRPDNPGYGYGFEVQVNFSAMKVRRVIAILKEAT